MLEINIISSISWDIVFKYYSNKRGLKRLLLGVNQFWCQIKHLYWKDCFKRLLKLAKLTRITFKDKIE